MQRAKEQWPLSQTRALPASPARATLQPENFGFHAIALYGSRALLSHRRPKPETSRMPQFPTLNLRCPAPRLNALNGISAYSFGIHASAASECIPRPPGFFPTLFVARRCSVSDCLLLQSCPARPNPSVPASKPLRHAALPAPAASRAPAVAAAPRFRPDGEASALNPANTGRTRISPAESRCRLLEKTLRNS